MSNTPITNECIKENKHIKFLEEDHWSLNGKFTYTHPIVVLCRKLERERDELLEALARALNATVLNHRNDRWHLDAEYIIEKIKPTL